jgi:hypothetical protein
VVVPQNGQVMLAMPSAESGATVTLIGLADGYTPAVLGEVEAKAFWEQAASTQTPFLSFSAAMQPGDFTIPNGEGEPPPTTSLPVVTTAMPAAATTVAADGVTTVAASAGDDDSGLGTGPIVLIVLLLAVLGWLGYTVTHGRGTHRKGA